MKAIVLVGGEGTRLRPLTLTQPKPAIRLVDRPFIRFMVDWLARHGIDEVVMACGFRAELLREALGDGRGGGPRIHYVEEPEPLGTAGPLRLAADEGLLDGRFLALNGDVLTDLDLTALVESHERNGAAATLALYPVADPTAYGLVRRVGGPDAPGAEAETADGAVEEFLEKPDPGVIDTDEVNAGAYVLEPGVIDSIPAGKRVSIEREVFPRMVGEGLYGHRLEGYWMDIGTPERYLQASWDILEGVVETDVARADDATLIDGRSDVSPEATVGPRAVVGAESAIDSAASVISSVLDSGCRIGARAAIEGSILARGVQVGADATVREGSVIGEGAVIEAGATLEPDARVEPAATVRA